jgi:HicB family
MQLSETVASLLEDVTRVASLGDQAVVEAASRLAVAIEGTATVRLLELLSQVADEIGRQLPHGRVEVRIAGREIELVYVEEEESSQPVDEDQSARISLRLPEQLKVRIERAAAREGVSTNTFIVRALGRSVASEQSGRSRHRLSGFGRA